MYRRRSVRGSSGIRWHVGVVLLDVEDDVEADAVHQLGTVGRRDAVKMFHISSMSSGGGDSFLDDHQAFALMAAQIRLKMNPSLSRRTWNGARP